MVEHDRAEALREFVAGSGCQLALLDWDVERVLGLAEAPGAVLEVWGGIEASGPVRFTAIAAAFRRDGTVAGLVSLETMPEVHDRTYLCLFSPDGLHHNLGRADLDEDFAEVAARLLVPLLAVTGVTSHAWYRRAAEAGFPRARRFLRTLDVTPPEWTPGLAARPTRPRPPLPGCRGP